MTNINQNFPDKKLPVNNLPDNNMPESFKPIRELIKKEETAALSSFRQKEKQFNTTLYEKIKQLEIEENPVHTKSFVPTEWFQGLLHWVNRPPVFASLLALVLIGILPMYFLVTAPSEHQRAVRQLTQFFTQVDQALNASSPSAYRDIGHNPVQTRLAQFFKGALIKAGSKEYTKEELKAVIEKALCYDCRTRDYRESTLSPVTDPEALDLERRIEALKNKKQNKMIDHFNNKPKNQSFS